MPEGLPQIQHWPRISGGGALSPRRGRCGADGAAPSGAGGRIGAVPPRGFTLVEILIATALSGLVLAAVLTANLQIIRSGVRITQYAEMSAQTRRGLEQLGHDLRIASGIKWNHVSSITLTLPSVDGATSSQVTYAWTSATQSLFSVPGTDGTVTAGRVHLIQGIPPLANGDPGLTFARFDRDGNIATTDLATKRVQVLLTGVRSSRTIAAATATAVSASFVLRNKPAS